MTNLKCHFDADGWLQGPINIAHHDCPNQYGRGSLPKSACQGVIMHTMVGDLPGTDSCFMNPHFGASAHFGISQEGEVIQWAPLTSATWAEVAGNDHWYSIEHADHTNPHNPITPAQALASAQVVEALSEAANFPLQEANSTGAEGYGCHYMGGASWGGHSCPDYPTPGTPFARSGQRPSILAQAKAIRGNTPVPEPTPTPTPTPVPETHPTLSEGDSGSAVKTAQTDLNKHGAAKPALTVDGDFGAKTEAAVKQFQKNSKITVDGVVGPVTWQWLQKSSKK